MIFFKFLEQTGLDQTVEKIQECLDLLLAVLENKLVLSVTKKGTLRENALSVKVVVYHFSLRIGHRHLRQSL